MRNEAKLKRWGVEPEKDVRFFYDREVGALTICVLRLSLDGARPLYTRGLAYCSPRDQFVKKTARVKALSRAIQAFARGEDVFIPISWVQPGPVRIAQFDVQLTDREKRAFGMVKEDR